MEWTPEDGGWWLCIDEAACDGRSGKQSFDDVLDPEPMPYERYRTRCPHPRRLVGQVAAEVTGRKRAGDEWPYPEAPVVAVESFAACRRWGCDQCSKGKRAEVMKHIQGGIDPHRRARLLTVTFADPLSVYVPGDVSEARRRVAELIREIRRQLGRDLEYAAVVEPTKRGRVHFHLVTTTPRWWPKLPKCSTPKGVPFRCECPDVVSSRMPYRGPCIQKLAHRAGCGWVDVRDVRSPRSAAAYLVKYLTKDTLHRALPRYTRRYAYSRQWSDDTLGTIYGRWLAGVRATAEAEAVERGESLPPWRDGSEWIVWEWRPLPRPPPPRPWLTPESDLTLNSDPR